MVTLEKLYKKITPATIRGRIHRYASAYIMHEVKKQTNKIVMFGPFKGMKIDLDDVYLSMLLGIFEKEIHPAFTKLSVLRFDRIINVGASEGYYAVGMALKWPQASVYTFETREDIYRAQIAKLAKDNLVSDRVNIRGHCSPSDLVDLLNPDKSTLLMLDIEGDEVRLLDPVVINGLRRTTILVELHDAFVPGCSKIIEERFWNTHSITKYTTLPRILADFPLRIWNIVNPIIGPYAAVIMRERPSIQEYFLMIPKNKNPEYSALNG